VAILFLLKDNTDLFCSDDLSLQKIVFIKSGRIALQA